VRVAPSGPARAGKFLMVPAALAALAREAPRHDVLVVRGTRVLGLPGLAAARAHGLRVVLQPELTGEMSGEVYTLGRPWAGRALGKAVRSIARVRSVLLRDADAFVAMSTPIHEELIAHGVAPERARLIPHGVDTERFRPATPAERRALRRALGLGEGTLIAWSGRLLRGKGLETLLEAFSGIVAVEPELRLVLVGSGEGQSLSIEAELRRAVEARGLRGRVVFTGRVDDVADHLRACDLFVFPSVFEALGISLVEAAACALPAVACRTGGIVDVVEDGGSGLLVPPNDPTGLAGALAALARGGARREALGGRAREIALARFDERESLRRYRTLFSELTAPSGASPRARAPRAGAAPPP
jgi:glycosyltransferase involved in cell wall biosynthesis